LLPHSNTMFGIVSYFCLDTYHSEAHSHKILRSPPSGNLRGVMSHFCHQVSYTTEAWHRVLENREDRFEAIRATIENLGGTFISVFFTTGRFDVLAITEFPNEVTPADIATAFAHGGAVASIQTIQLLTASEVIEAHTQAPQPIYSTHSRKYAAAATVGT
jgi:uncharacterized protein with GYD domain